MQKKKGKTTPNQRGIFGALQNKAKVNNRKRHESFKNNNFFMRPKNTRKSIDHQKTEEKFSNISNIITLKAPKKPIQHSLFLDTPK
jgi:hypothetical protein